MNILTRHTLQLILPIQLIGAFIACTLEYFVPGLVSFTLPLQLILITFVLTWLLFVILA